MLLTYNRQNQATATATTKSKTKIWFSFWLNIHSLCRLSPFFLLMNESRSWKFCLKALRKRAYIIFERRPSIKFVHSKYSNIRFSHLTLRGCKFLDYPPLYLKLLKNYPPHLPGLLHLFLLIFLSFSGRFSH